MKKLHLNLKRKWFDMILSGEKKEEYREFKKYWIDRLTEDKSYCAMENNGYVINEMMFIGNDIGVIMIVSMNFSILNMNCATKTAADALNIGLTRLNGNIST